MMAQIEPLGFTNFLIEFSARDSCDCHISLHICSNVATFLIMQRSSVKQEI